MSTKRYSSDGEKAEIKSAYTGQSDPAQKLQT